ncbi:MAG TPA: mechanosensitive ion channel domain-containing protein [Gemmatimonadaceae bacterium]|nr:mechanosensitive ion channel domain-containing protein [Gemmatimonadaceae bacterium]
MLNGETEHRVLLTVALIAAIIVVSWLLQLLMRVSLRGNAEKRVSFWARQIVRLLGIIAVIVGIIEIWHPDAKSAGGAIGLITAGVAVALQRVITSFAAYLIILRGKIFNVGDRITIGGVRGDVIALDFMQTTVLEIGETPGEQHDAPSVWITARQYTGRLIRVTNDKIFDSPVYNFTRVFPYLWEEMQLPISYKDNRREAERILLEVGHRHTDDIVREAKPHIEKLVKEYRLATTPEIEPHVYMRLTDNWVNFSLRFLIPIEGARAIKDAMSRDLIDGLDAAGIGIASGTYEIVGMPKLEVQVENRP